MRFSEYIRCPKILKKTLHTKALLQRTLQGELLKLIHIVQIRDDPIL